MTETQSGLRKIDIVLLAIIFAVGIFLRLTPQAFAPGAPLHSIAVLHPQPAFNKIGFDEGLYREYVNALNDGGLGSYPDIVQGYIDVQKKLPGSILPPLRFLYIFTASLWHSLFGSEALDALHQVAAFFSTLTLALAAAFAWRIRGPTWAIAVGALMAVAPTQLHMSQHALVDGFFTFWALLVLWLFWENLQAPRDWRWLVGYIIALALLVLTKENSFFVWVALVVLLVTNRWFQFGTVKRELVIATLLGPLLGIVVLIFLAGGIDVFCAKLSIVGRQKFPTPLRDPDRRRTVVPVPGRSSPGQPDCSASRARNSLSVEPHDETRTLYVDLYRCQLSGDVQREVRNEPPLRQHVGLALAFPRL